MVELERFFANTSGNPIQHAFSQRGLHMPANVGKCVAPKNYQRVWQDIQCQKRHGPSVMYLHVPFCANHCLFCGFYRNQWRDDYSAPYTDCLIKELEQEADSVASASRPINAVYFGGGTPTALHAYDLKRVISRIREHYPLASDCEITVEGRIDHFDDGKIEACLDAGANRFSTGVQSFNTQVRQRQGRKATMEEAIRFFENLRDKNRAAVVCDLILGLPYQSDEVWQSDLKTVVELGLDGADLYTLAVFSGSPLSQAVEKKKIDPAISLDQQGLMYQVGSDYLKEQGWHQISSSHWGCGTRERNLYNRLIKSGAECLAFGSGAGGHMNGYRYAIEGELQRYYKRINEGEKPLSQISKTSSLNGALNKLAAGIEVMRLDLVDLEASEPATRGFRLFVAPLLRNWRIADLIQGDAVVTLTAAGRFWHQILLAHLKSALQIYCTVHQSHSLIKEAS